MVGEKKLDAISFVHMLLLFLFTWAAELLCSLQYRQCFYWRFGE